MISRFVTANNSSAFGFQILWPIAIGLVLGAPSVSPGQNTLAPLWEIGKPDRQDVEFALAPNRYHQFREDGFFVVGRSQAERDWPYVHPGPSDGWAGGRQH